MKQSFMGQMAHQDFQVIGLWDLEAEQVLALNNPALLPFVPLMHGGNTEQMLRRCATLIRQQPAYALEMESILSVFAGYVMDSDLIKRILRWEMLELIQESPLVKDILEERERAGEQRAMLKSLYKILLTRFNVDSEYCEQLGLENAEIAVIEKLQEVALTAPNLEGFEEGLHSLDR